MNSPNDYPTLLQQSKLDKCLGTQAPRTPSGTCTESKVLPLTNSTLECLVSASDFEELSKFKWWFHKNQHFGYVKMRGRGDVFLHCFLLGRSMVDHRDGNTLNNTRGNLRPCTHAQNSRNARKWSSRTTHSIFKGVSPDGRVGWWRARITFEEKQIPLGIYESEELAAKAYDSAALFLFGEFSRTNFKESSAAMSPDLLASMSKRKNRLNHRRSHDGVSRARSRKSPWRAYIQIGKSAHVHIGSFKTRTEALAARAAVISMIERTQPLNPKFRLDADAVHGMVNYLRIGGFK